MATGNWPREVVMPMLRSVHNGLGTIALSAIMAITPLVPAAVSSTPPQWVWDKNGKVSDVSGQFRSISNEEACAMGYTEFCIELIPTSDPIGSLGDSDLGGGCK